MSMHPTSVKVKTNSFEIIRLPVKSYHQYDIFTPEIDIPSKRQRAIHILQVSVAPQTFQPRAVYDGKSLLYVSHELMLPGGSGSWNVHLGDPNAPPSSPSVVRIRITKTAGVVIQPTHLNRLVQEGQQITSRTATATNLLQLLISQSTKQQYPTNRGHAFFSDVGSQSLGPGIGVELWRGFFQSVRPAIGRMLITIDTSTVAVYRSGDLISVAMEFLNFKNVRQLRLKADDRNFLELEKYFKNRLIKTETTGERLKTIHGLIAAPVGPYRFDKDGMATTIQDHFYRAYSKTLRYPEIFGVRLSGRNAPFPVIVPAELCKVQPGQLYKRRLPSAATPAVVRFATMVPDVRFKAITGYGSSISPIKGYRNSEAMIDAGMAVDTTPLTLDAKILVAPKMMFNKDMTREPINGSWNVLNMKFRTSKSLKIWGVVNFDGFRISEAFACKVVGHLMESCRSLGMKVSPPTVNLFTGNGHSVDEALEAVYQEILKTVHQGIPKHTPDPIDMIIVLLPSSAEAIRTQVKYWGDVKRGIRTSCMREDNLQTARSHYYNNVAIKINARLGGCYAVPQSIVLENMAKDWLTSTRSKPKDDPFMIMGADVAHPGPGINKPSVASLVWSYDQHASSYVTFSQVQNPRQEIIVDLRGMVRQAVWEFYKKDHVTPKRIVFYRDGVSEGEFSKVGDHEIADIDGANHLSLPSNLSLTSTLAAFLDVWQRGKLTAPKPLLTFIIVVKRHHVRFFPSDSSSADKTGNCRPGLVVENGLRSPFAQDFYLQSHGAILGTSRSGHYAVLRDDNFKNVALIQELSYDLCHVYAKATRSVSIPAPVYYADLVCARAKFRMDPETGMDLESSTDGGGSDVFDLGAWRTAYKPINTRSNYDKTMYFL
ncbi:Piwi domain-containing protein [Mycena sp. CBHHK59/15]|nr:Piwi domain-containing protein [Mycena sp. CBHHK59/15]